MVSEITNNVNVCWSLIIFIKCYFLYHYLLVYFCIIKLNVVIKRQLCNYIKHIFTSVITVPKIWCQCKLICCVHMLIS